MLSTNPNQSLNFYYDSTKDSTVYVNSGVAWVGNYIMDFRGGNKNFAQMTNFGTQSNVYQYSVLCLQPAGGFPDMTSITFTPVDSTTSLVPPNTISPLAGNKPLGLFLFYTDGTSTTLTSASRIQ